MAELTVSVCAVRTDGFSVDMTVVGASADTVASFDEGTLPLSPNATITVTSEGYSTSGVLGTVVRSVYITSVMRKPSPNEADFDETISGSDLIIRCSLSDNIYDDDQDGGAGTSGTDPVLNMSAGFITFTDSDTTAAVVSLTCTNSSTLDYPEVVGQWDWDNTPFFKRVEATFNMAFRARHGFGIAAVKLEAIGVSSATDTNSLATAVTSQTTQNGLFHESYQQSVSLTSYTQAENITLNAIGYPVVGDANSILDTSTNTTATDRIRGLTEITCTCDKTTALRDYAIVTTTGNDGTGAKSTTLATAESNPYLTIGAALASNATVIYVRTGLTYDILGSDPVAVTARDYFIEVRPHPSDSAAGITLDRGGSFRPYNASKLAFIGFTGDISYTSGNGWIDGEEAGNKLVLIEDSNLPSSGTPTAGLGYKSDGCWYINCTGMGTDQYGGVSTSRNAYSFTGCTFTSSFFVHAWYAAIACDSTAADPFFSEKGATAIAPNQDNVMFEYNSFKSMVANGGYQVVLADLAAVAGASIIGNVLETKTITISASTFSFGASNGSATDLTNVIVAHNTLSGERANLFYNDSGSSANVRNNIWLVGNAFKSYNIKSDVFVTANANRIGNWAMMNGVGYRDNVYDGAASTTFVNDYDGLNVSYETSADATFGQMGYVDEQSSDVGGAGGGDYTPDTGSALTGHTLTDPFITYDLNGNTINSEIGAIQILVASSAEGVIVPSDTSDVLILINDMYVGGTGNIKVTTAAGEIVTFSNVPVGIFEPGCRIKKVFDTGTTAINLIGIIR